MPETSTAPEQPIAPAPNFISESHVTEFEFAAMLGVDVRTVRGWWAKRTGPARTKVGAANYYAKEAIRRWLESNEQKPCRQMRSKRSPRSRARKAHNIVASEAARGR